jgi:hypothetical protein
MATPANEQEQDPAARTAECWNYSGNHVAALVDDCNRMLTYATDKGISISKEDSKNVSAAGQAFARGRWTDEVESNLYTTKSTLAEAIKPVTTETLAPGALHSARKSTRFYFRATLAIAGILVPLSMVVFANAKLTSSSKYLIEENDKMSRSLYNELEDHRDKIVDEKARLIANSASSGSSASATRVGRAENYTPFARIPVCMTPSGADGVTAMNVGTTTCSLPETLLKNDVSEPGMDADERLADTPPALVIKETLQEFARNNRTLYAQTRWLSWLNLAHVQNVYSSPWMLDPAKLRENLELHLPILTNPNRSKKLDASTTDETMSPEHAIDDGLQKIAVYQDIRAMAQDAQRTSDILWAAITTYVLPVLYAVLGSLAFILRDLSEQSVSKTFHPTHGRFVNRVRLVIAVIIGTVIGLFDNLWHDSVVSASPLAIAFIGGYAANTFFAFLDTNSHLGKSHSKPA